MAKRLDRRFRSATLYLRAACLMAAVAILSGCVVVPAYGPHYYRPAPYYYR